MITDSVWSQRDICRGRDEEDVKIFREAECLARVNFYCVLKPVFPALDVSSPADQKAR